MHNILNLSYKFYIVILYSCYNFTLFLNIYDVFDL